MQSNIAAGNGLAGGRLAMLLVGAMVLGGGNSARAGNLFGSPPVPDWVKTAAQEKLPEFRGNPKAVGLLEETTYTVDQKGQAVEHVGRVVKMLRPQGGEDG